MDSVIIHRPAFAICLLSVVRLGERKCEYGQLFKLVCSFLTAAYYLCHLFFRNLFFLREPFFAVAKMAKVSPVQTTNNRVSHIRCIKLKEIEHFFQVFYLLSVFIFLSVNHPCLFSVYCTLIF